MGSQALCVGWVLLGLALAAEVPSRNPRELGVVVPRECRVKGGKLILRVDSGGCTDASSLRARVRKEQGPAANTPRYVVTFERIRVDDCKALLLDGVLLEYDLAEDLGITGPHTLTVAGCPAAEVRLRQELHAATLTALELELRACRARLKTAHGGAGPAGNLETFKRQAEELEARLAEHRRLDPRDYPLPAEAGPLDPLKSGPVVPPVVRVVTATIPEPCREGSQLEVAGGTKSGPFYHLAGVVGGDYGLLKPGRTYELTLHLVYRREYFGFIPNHYVYVAGAK